MSLSLNESYAFDTFIAKKDDPALVVAKKIVEEPGGMENPVIFYGGIGTGKTHLLQAIGNRLKKKFDVIYTTVEVFTIEHINSIQDGNTENDIRSISSRLIEIGAGRNKVMRWTSCIQIQLMN
jgi:chromosomal replication initiator protein